MTSHRLPLEIFTVTAVTVVTISMHALLVKGFTVTSVTAAMSVTTLSVLPACAVQIHLYHPLGKASILPTAVPVLKMSEALRLIYEERFFTEDLQLSPAQIEPFLYYLDSKVSPKNLLKKNNEFQLIDFLVNQSRDFIKSIEE